MIIQADAVTRVGWVLRDWKTGHMQLETLCDSQEDAFLLLAARRIHQPHDPHVQPVAVCVTVTEVKP